MAKKANTKSKVSVTKSSRQLSLPKKPEGAPFSEQDPKRRLGNFAGAGEHARQGGRTTGIVGQTKQKNKTDKTARKK